jgi:hypothetical protein
MYESLAKFELEIQKKGGKICKFINGEYVYFETMNKYQKC